MAKFTKQTGGGTSFHGTTFEATPKQLIDLFPNSYETNGDKTNYDFTLETESGKCFTIYDWKYYRSLGMDEMVTWHVGAKDKLTSIEGSEEVKSMLNVPTI